MILGILHINKKVKAPSRCTQCREYIELGQLHAVVVLRYGVAQRRLVASRQQTSRRRQKAHAGLLYVRVHLGCLKQWLPNRYEAIHEGRAERKGGRPTGSTPLAGLPDDVLTARKRMIRRRAALLRRVLVEDRESVLDRYYASFVAIDEWLSEGIPRVRSQVRLNDGQRQVIVDKLMAAKRRTECS